MVKYWASATHQEILKGLGGSPKDCRHVFAFCRNVSDEDCDPDLVALKSLLRVRLPAQNVLTYEADDLEGLGQNVARVLGAVIETEAAGYWDMLRTAKPEPLITAGARTMADWTKLGKRVFHEMDIPYLRSYDPKLMEILRSADEFKKLGGHPQKDGTVYGMRWAPTSKGLALTIQDCATCHSRVLPDGSILDGAPLNDPGDGVFGAFVGHDSPGFLEFFSPDETPGMVAWRFWGVPWVADDINERFKSPASDINPRDFGFTIGLVPRFNSSPFYRTKMPDLIGVKDRKYIDHTATHRLRGPEDLMRYAALVSCCDIADFGPHRMLTNKGRRILYRFPDELLFALAQYIDSIEPPRNPNLGDPRATAGKKVFDREGCGGCHTPPLYTNNKLSLAAGFTPPPDHPLRADILPISVGTDPSLALKTRKGTGLYKVPSLLGVWYRGLFGHDGSVTTLEQWFDPARLRDDYVPSGFKGYKVTHGQCRDMNSASRSVLKTGPC